MLGSVSPSCRLRAASAAIGAALCLLLDPGALAAQPWSDPDPRPPRERIPHGALGLELGAELGAALAHVDELDLADEDLTWAETRLRTEAAVDDGDRLRLVVGLDALDGVPWGLTTSGERARLSPPRAGIGVLDVDYQGEGARDDPRAYGPAVVTAPGATLRRAYGEAWLPFGRLRFGRQAAVAGTTLLGADGAARTQRFGEEHGGDVVDRLELFVRPLAGLDAPPDEEERGFGVTLAYDRLDLVAPSVDARQRLGATARLLAVFPTVEQVFDLRGTARFSWGERGAFTRELEGVVLARVADLSLGFDGVLREGESAAEAGSLAPLVGARPRRAWVRQWGSRSVLRWDTQRVGAYLELDTASGDADPTPGSDLTRFVFPGDANVGLLLFERVLAYAAARAAAADAAALADAGLPTDAADAVATRGAFTGAVAVFPQLDVQPHRALLLRAGVLLAWAPEPLIDPLRSLEGGGSAVNLRGGAAGSYYGTEVDLRARYRYRERFFFDLEAATLTPGSALADEEGRAARATLVQGRTTVAF
jgi:hypothetical protein